MNKVTVAAVTILLAAFGGLVAWAAITAGHGDLSGIDSKKIITAQELNGNIADHVRGKEDSDIIVIEYADPQCPGCATTMPTMTTLYEKYGDRVAFVFRHYDLSYHQNARASSAAAESAGFQGYFWEMLEALYARQDEWQYYTNTEERTNYFKSVFAEISEGKGDAEKFASDLNSADIQKKISFDARIGKELDSISETPTIIMGGEKADITGDLESALQKVLKAHGVDSEPKKTEE